MNRFHIFIHLCHLHLEAHQKLNGQCNGAVWMCACESVTEALQAFCCRVLLVITSDVCYILTYYIFHSWACSRSCAHMLNLWLFVSIAGWIQPFITLFAPSSRLAHAAVSVLSRRPSTELGPAHERPFLRLSVCHYVFIDSAYTIFLHFQARRLIRCVFNFHLLVSAIAHFQSNAMAILPMCGCCYFSQLFHLVLLLWMCALAPVRIFSLFILARFFRALDIFVLCIFGSICLFHSSASDHTQHN